jgi:hypothetical protein
LHVQNRSSKASESISWGFIYNSRDLEWRYQRKLHKIFKRKRTCNDISLNDERRDPVADGTSGGLSVVSGKAATARSCVIRAFFGGGKSLDPACLRLFIPGEVMVVAGSILSLLPRAFSRSRLASMSGSNCGKADVASRDILKTFKLALMIGKVI